MVKKDREEKWGPLPVQFFVHWLTAAMVSVFVVILLAIIVNGFPNSWEALFGGNFSETRLLAASQAIIQFDSFATAAWVAGFALFWGLLGREWGELQKEIAEIIAIVETQSEERGSHEVQLAGKVAVDSTKDWSKRLASRRRTFFFSALFPLTYFVGSGLVAIAAILTGHPFYVWWSLYLLLLGTGTALVSWYWLYDYSSFLSEQRSEETSLKRKLSALKITKST